LTRETTAALRLRYHRKALFGDYARAGGGLLMCLAAIALSGWGGRAFYAFAGLACVFALFGARAALKQASVVELSATGLCRRILTPGPLGPIGPILFDREISFAELKDFRLLSFGRRKAGGRGVVQLILRAGRARLTLDQDLEEFDAVVLLGLEAAEARRIALDPATQANLARLGYS
jgi:hypothetical protein